MLLASPLRFELSDRKCCASIRALRYSATGFGGLVISSVAE